MNHSQKKTALPKNNSFNFLLHILLIALLAGCANTPRASNHDELDAAIREASNYLNSNITSGNKLVILNFNSDYQSLSEYIIDELISNTVNDKNFTIVDRANLMLIQQEINFQMSGDVNDETAVSIGQMLGAQTIISGAVSRFGDLFRLRVRALNVETAQIEGQFNRNIENSPTIALLLKNTSSPSLASNNAPNNTAVNTTGGRAENVAEYKIGDTGPAGGIVFFDKGNRVGGWRYLEAAPVETEIKAIWAHESRSIDNVINQRALGLGKLNTQKIMDVFVNRGGGFDTAARACFDLILNGFDDWFLPSFDELNWMYGNLHRKGLGEFKNERFSYYWSSTQEYSSSTFVIDFSNGQRASRDIIYSQYVRAIRQF